MEIFLVIIYFVIGIDHGLTRICNPNPALRPVWTSSPSVTGWQIFGGVVLLTLIWPLSKWVGRRKS